MTIQSSMLASPLSPSFLIACNLLSLMCKALYVVIDVLVFWFICLSSSLVHFKTCPGYVTKEAAQVLIPLKRFLPKSLVSRFFVLRYSFLIFPFISASLTASASKYL